eukprot:591457-Prorocentrum_minimum.AAC.3
MRPSTSQMRRLRPSNSQTPPQIRKRPPSNSQTRPLRFTNAAPRIRKRAPQTRISPLLLHDSYEIVLKNRKVDFFVLRGSPLLGTAGPCGCGGAGRGGAGGRGQWALLLGDACHCFPPDLGQGVNSALQDVCVLDDALERYPLPPPPSASKSASEASGQTGALHRGSVGWSCSAGGLESMSLNSQAASTNHAF